MADSIQVRGADQLADLARDIKATGDKELRRELFRGIQRATIPIRKVLAPQAARDGLPRKGGLNEYVAASKFSTRTRAAGRNPAVYVTGSKKGHDIAATNRGRLRHPVFGNRNAWVLQQITPGWWDKGVSDSKVVPIVRHELLKVLDDIERRISRG